MSHPTNPTDETTHLLPSIPSAAHAADADADANASIIPPTKVSQFPQHQRPPTTKKSCLYWLTVTIWISGAIFGSFALLHYIRRYYIPNYACTTTTTMTMTTTTTTTTTTQSAWDRTDPNLYRPTHPIANRVMITHLMGGVFLMAAGPFQLLECIRRRNMGWHRWVGRAYVFAALLASSCATIWTLVWRTSRCNIHEDVGNVVFGVGVFTSGVQTFRYIVDFGGGSSSTTSSSTSSSSRCISSHKLWAWRLYACVLGAPLYRLYNTIYAVFVLYTPWKGSLFVENAIFYTTVIPGLIVVQILWWRNDDDARAAARRERRIIIVVEADDDDTIAVKEDYLEGALDRSGATTNRRPLLQLVEPVWIQISLVFVVVTTLIISFTLWLPAMLGRDPGVVADIYHDFCTGR